MNISQKKTTGEVQDNSIKKINTSVKNGQFSGGKKQAVWGGGLALK